MMRTAGFCDLIASAMPDIRPPPESLHQHRIEIGHLFQHFQAERALAGDHVRMFERRDHGVAFLADQAPGFNFGLVLGFADDAGFGAERANRFELVLRHQFRHANDAGDAGLPG